MSDPHIISAAVQEQRAAIVSQRDFENLYKQYAPFLLRVCQALCHDENLAADMMQEVFCSIWDRRTTISVKGSWENYLYRCAKYQYYNHQRSLSRFRTVQDSVFAASDESDDSTQEHIEYRELTHNVNQLVKQLPDQCRKVYQMSRGEGLNTAEISKELSLSEKTVKNHLTKALGFLRRNIEALFAFIFLIS
jgi:RNA polymerase sigma-70 factor (family 1)